MGKAKVKLEKDLLEKVKKYAALSGYSSAEEFVTHCLEKEISKLYLNQLNLTKNYEAT